MIRLAGVVLESGFASSETLFASTEKESNHRGG